MKFNTQTLVAILTTTTAAQKVDGTSLTGAAASKVSSYLAHVTAEPEYASFASVASTAVKTKWLQSFLSGDLSKVSTKSWYTELPNDIKSFAASVHSDILKIATGDASVATITATATSASATSASASESKSASSVSQTVVNAASSASKSASSAASKASSSAASVTKNVAAETGASRMIGVVAAGALGVLML